MSNAPAISNYPGRQATEHYTISCIAFLKLSSDDLVAWKSVRSRSGNASAYSDPDWMRGYFDKEQLDNLFIFLLYHSGALRGAAAFLKLKWPLTCHIGPVRIARFPLTRLRLIGELPDFPEEPEAYGHLFDAIRGFKGGADTVMLESIPVDSLFWRCAAEQEHYSLAAPAPHPMLRVSGTFEDYLKSLPKGHRHNLKRKVTRFERESPGTLTWKRYTRPEEVGPFLDYALAISRKTYQWKVFGRGLSDVPRITRRLQFAAANGWFRSYLLFCGETPAAFALGWQHHGCYEHHEIGYDPALRQWAPGSVLHMYMLRDVFQDNPPSVLDFGAYGWYKAEMANESRLDGSMFLFPASRRVSLAFHTYRFCDSLTKTISHRFKEWDIAKRVRRLVRT